jgi:hypothetical protein
MECTKAVAQQKWMFGEQGRDGAIKFTLFFFPEHDAEQLLSAIREALTRLPTEITVLAVEKIEPDPSHPAFGKWRSDGVSYYVWEWETDPGMLLSTQLQLASMALKFNGDLLVRLRESATLHVGIPALPGKR